MRRTKVRCNDEIIFSNEVIGFFYNAINIAVKRKHTKKKPIPSSYRQRTYRRLVEMEDLVSFEVKIRETDLQILAPQDLSDSAFDLVLFLRNQLDNYINSHPEFVRSLAPLPHDPLAPKVVQDMLRSGIAAGVGPMAAVAGVMAEYVGKGLIEQHGIKEMMVENGGDIFLLRRKDCTISIFAGTSPLSNNVGIRIECKRMPLGICTSSASVGHSLSLGQADAVTVLSSSTALADAVATRLGNEVKDDDINHALALAADIEGISGVVIIKGEQLGAWGEVELVGV